MYIANLLKIMNNAIMGFSGQFRFSYSQVTPIAIQNMRGSSAPVQGAGELKAYSDGSIEGMCLAAYMYIY